MSLLLFVIGAITLVFGALTIGYGIPINEFSFGNTLIMAGTTAAVGGMIVIGLGAVVAHLQRVAEVMAMRAPPRPARAPDMPDVGRVPVASHVPFPPNSKAEPAMGDAPPVEPPLTTPVAVPAEEFVAHVDAPTLPNPDIPPPEAVEEAPPVPPPFAAMPPAGAEPSEPAFASKPPAGFNGSGAEERAREPLPAWLSAPPPPPPPVAPRAPEEASFEAVWPAAEDRAARWPANEEAEPMAATPTAPEVEPEVAAPQPASERRTAVLKSGVVDGMAYTLYVDGSIEAELPQGTLRFASINELREHLERTS
jgi:hypothetical protein